MAVTACVGMNQDSGEFPVAGKDHGLLRYSVRDAVHGGLIPAKLTFLGRDATPDPIFTRTEIGYQEPDAVRAHNRVMSISGSGVIPLPAGSYEVYVSRGPEWTLVKQPLEIAPRHVTRIDAALRKVIASTGWISGDFHVHASSSLDSIVPMSNRVAEFISDGIDLICSTDHNTISDYGPVIKALGAEHLLMSMAGEEITTGDWGHFGAFPLAPRLNVEGGGAVHVANLAPRDILSSVRRDSPRTFINVNHPRLPRIGYFVLGEYDPHTDVAKRRGFTTDFDGVEVLNGYQDPNRETVERVIDDWYALLDHGHIVTAMGNSDTHLLRKNLGGYPRNYLYVGTDDYAQLDSAGITRAIKEHRVFFTTGPFVDLRVGDAGLGDLVSARDGLVRVSVEVEAAPWIDVDTVRLIVNGKTAKQWDIGDRRDVTRLRASQVIRVTRDSYLLVRADGNEILFPVIGDQEKFKVYPFAMTNPVFIDADGNGRFDAPDAEHAHRPE